MGCREESPKREMLRIVRTPDGEVKADPAGRCPGRGAYLCYSEDCLAAARSRDSLSKALKTRVEQVFYDELLEIVRTKDETGAPAEP